MRKRSEIERKKVILTMSCLVKRKGIDTVVRNLPAILKEIPDCVYVVAGSGPDKERLVSIANAIGMNAHVVFTGGISDTDVNELYNACDVFVRLSRSAPPNVEVFGIVFLEAGACEKPVIGGKGGGIPDAVDEGENGYWRNPNK